MKKTFGLLLLLLCCSIMLLMPSCTKESDIEFDESLLYGKWQEGTVFEKYNADGTGSTWDTSDDVSEDEAQAFEWTLSKDDLTQIHIMEIGGGRIPKSYTVTVLTSNNLKYHDAYDSHSFTKVN